VVKECRPYTKDTLRLFFVVEGVALSAYSLEFKQQWLDVSEGLWRVSSHSRFTQEIAHALIAQVRQNCLTSGRGVWFFALTQWCVESNGTLTINAFEKNGVALFIHRQASRHTSDRRKFAQRRQSEFTYGGLLTNEVA
jgi:hypothetical protein